MITLTDPASGGLEPLRAEIESVCILHVVGSAGCSSADLAERLGLSRELAGVIQEAIAPLIATGHLDMNGALVLLTEAGKEWLDTRLSKLRVGQP